MPISGSRAFPQHDAKVSPSHARKHWGGKRTQGTRQKTRVRVSAGVHRLPGVALRPARQVAHHLRHEELEALALARLGPRGHLGVAVEHVVRHPRVHQPVCQLGEAEDAAALAVMEGDVAEVDPPRGHGQRFRIRRVCHVDRPVEHRHAVVNDADILVRTTNLASVTPDMNKPVMNGTTAEAVTPNIVAATSSPLAVFDGNASTQLVTKIARRENINELAVTPDPAQQLVPGRAAAVATLRDPDREVTIRAAASSWVEIVRGDGTAVLRKLMKAGETYVVDDGSALYLSTGNAGGIELVTAGNQIITIGMNGEIVRDLPLSNTRLGERS